MPFYTNNILLTGYWPPTNAMLRQFSVNKAQNPAGRIGEVKFVPGFTAVAANAGRCRARRGQIIAAT